MISVLYVDDESGLLEVARVFLEETGEFSVTTSTSAKEALELLSTRSFDAIISDYQMPGMDGIAFLVTVRGWHDNTPFILFTGRGREEIVIEAINNGADFYLQKGGDPVSQFAELAHKIRQAVRRRETERELKRSEYRLRSFLETTRESVSLVDESGKVLEWNTAAEQISGIRREEAVGSAIWDLTFRLVPRGHRTEERRAAIEQTIRAALRTGIPVFEEPRVIEAERPDGSRIFTRQSHFSFRTDKGFGLGSISQDITAEKQAELVLRESEQKFHNIFSNINDAILILELDDQFRHLKFVDVNDVACRMTGYTRDELLQMTAADLDHGEYSRTNDLINRDLAEKGASTFETTYTRKDQSRFPVEVSIHLATLNGRRVTVAVVRDITDRKASEAAWQAIIRGMVGTTGINSLDRITEEVTKWLGADCVMVGEIQPDHLSVKVLSMILDGNHVSDFSYTLKNTPCENVAEKGFCFYPKDSVLLFPKAKDIVDLKIQGYVGTPLWNSRGEVIGILCALSRGPMQLPQSVRGILDIIAVKAASEIERTGIERELRQSEEKFRSFVENASEIVFSLTPEGFFTYVSPNVADLLGYDAAGVIGKPSSDYIHPDDYPKNRDLFREAVRSRKKITGLEYRIRHRNGSWLWYSQSISPVFDPGGNIIVVQGICHDITERRKAEEALRQANQKLNLLSGITRHDINNQLMALNGYLVLLQKEVSGPASDRFFPRITTASRNIAEMIEFTKEYEQIGTVAPVWQDLTSVISTGGKGILPGQIAFCNDLPAGTEIFADSMLEKVFFNLFDNAIRHGQRVTQFRVSSRPDGDNLVVVWEDNGVGIAAGEKERIFDKGFGKNTGLGMFLVREILSLTGITIRETGEPGTGARFNMTVPHGSWRIRKSV